MVIGIVLPALGVKTVIGHVEDHLGSVAAVGLGGGVALFLTAQTAYRVRCDGRLHGQRLVAAAACVVIVPVPKTIPPCAREDPGARLSKYLLAGVVGNGCRRHEIG